MYTRPSPAPLSRLPLLRRLLAVLALLALPGLAAAAEDALLQRLADGGHVLMMRHALAPGVGDPASFDLGDCATQRNLSDEGRAQARRIGALLRERGVPVEAVLSSQWCRCMETARLLDLGEVQPAPMLNSFFADRATEPAQTAAARAHIAAWTPAGGNLLMVTHQVNISAVSGEYTSSGEMVVLDPAAEGGPHVVGSIAIR